MFYAVITEDIPNSWEKRAPVRELHLSRIRQLQEEGRLISAGPFPNEDTDDIERVGVSGSLIIAEFSDLQTAENWAKTDPYAAVGVYAHISVKPYKQVLPE